MFAKQIDDQPKQVPRRLEKSLLASGMRQLPGLRIEVVPTACSTSRLTPAARQITTAARWLEKSLLASGMRQLPGPRTEVGK